MRKEYRAATATLLLIVALLVSLGLSGCESLPTAAPQTTAAPPSAEPPQSTGTLTQSPAPASASPEPATAEPTATEAAATATATAEPTAEVTPSPEPTATPAPTAPPKPTATPIPKGPWNDGDRSDVKVTKYYTTTLPAGLKLALKYKRYPAYYDYFVVLKSSTVRALPDTRAKSMQSVKLAQRYQMLAQVKGKDGKSVWYRVRVPGKGVGYLPASAGTPMAYQVAKAYSMIRDLKLVTDQPGTVRINNYKNRNGKPPAYSGKEQDAFGYLRDQAAPAYLTPDKSSSFRYAPDGTLARLLGTKGDFSQVYIPTFDEVRYIPSKYIASSKTDLIKSLTQVIVVDRKHQNIMTFEYAKGTWSIASMCYVSTGKNTGFSKPTPLGIFAAIEKKRAGKYGIGEFWYLADGADPGAEDLKFEGYAPYAVRFSGGAYLHGLPRGVTYVTDPVTGESTLVMPGSLVSESYGTFLGVRPESHMCVRNYSSHAKFMWEWTKIGSAAVIVIQ